MRSRRFAAPAQSSPRDRPPLAAAEAAAEAAAAGAAPAGESLRAPAAGRRPEAPAAANTLYVGKHFLGHGLEKVNPGK